MSSPASSNEKGERRDRSIRLSLLTSLLSKFGTIILRLVSIPITIRVLGMELFGVYTAITLFVALIDILHVGIGPNLTKEISKALAKGETPSRAGGLCHKRYPQHRAHFYRHCNRLCPPRFIPYYDPFRSRIRSRGR